MNGFDTVLFGAGIAGTSLAWRLAPQQRVLLLEREAQPGMHSTGRSAAMFIESYGPAGVRALTRASRAFYEAPPAGFCDGPLLTPRGTLYVAAPGQEALLDRTEAELAPACPRLQRLAPAEALRRVPGLRPEMLVGALFDPDAQDIDVHALHQAFLRGARRSGGVLMTDTVVRSARRAGDAWELDLADGSRVRANAVVNAAGAWADEVGALFGAAPVGLQPCRRSAFTFPVPAGWDVSAWPAVIGIDEGWYVKPDAGRLLGSPANADPTVPHDVQPEEIDIATGIHRIEAALQLEIRRPASTWAGLRSFVRDGEPVIGHDAHCPGFFWLAAQGGYGIQSAAGASALAAALLTDQPLPDDLTREGVDPAVFAPGRLR